MSVPLVTASGYIKAGRLMVRDRAQFDAAISGLKDGWEVELEVVRLRATRSQPQNRFYWGVVLHTLSQHTGYTPEELHDLMKCKFLPKERAFLDGNGEVVEQFVLGGSTRSLDTSEFSTYVNQIRDWASSVLNCYIPEADEAGYGAGV
jgi:hypothetical protein